MQSFQGLAKYLCGPRAPTNSAGTIRNMAEILNQILDEGVLQHWLGKYRYLLPTILLSKRSCEMRIEEHKN